MERWKSGPLKPARQMSCSGEASRNRLSCPGPRSSSMVTDQRMVHIEQTGEISPSPMDERCFWVDLLLMLQTRSGSSGISGTDTEFLKYKKFGVCPRNTLPRVVVMGT